MSEINARPVLHHNRTSICATFPCPAGLTLGPAVVVRTIPALLRIYSPVAAVLLRTLVAIQRGRKDSLVPEMASAGLLPSGTVPLFARGHIR